MLCKFVFTKERYMTFQADSRKCPSCGGNLIFSTEDQGLTCSFCGNVFDPGKLDLMDIIADLDKDDSTELEDDKNEIVCGACGAHVITDKNTTATFCAFCGSPSLVTQRLSRQFRPDYLIPFKISKEDAQKRIERFAKTRKYVPNNFYNRSTFKKITGIYVPFWLMDSACTLHTNGYAYKNHISGRDRYSVVSDMEIRFKNVPFDGALAIEDDIMESIEPFDCSELKEFKTSYLQGFYSQRYDLSADKLSDRILGRLQRYGKEAASASLSGYDSKTFGICTARPHDLTQKYALFPVWILTYEYDGLIYKIAVNGQTGKTDGYLPTSKIKRALRLSLYYAHNALMTMPIVIPLVLLGILIRSYFDSFLACVYFVLICVIFCLPVFSMYRMAKIQDEDFTRFSALNIVRKAIRKFFDKRKTTLLRIKNDTNVLVGERPSVNEYYDTTSKAVINNREVFDLRESYTDRDA